MTKLLSALMAAVFAAATVTPVAFAADKMDDKKEEAKKKKGDKKEAEKK